LIYGNRNFIKYFSFQAQTVPGQKRGASVITAASITKDYTNV